MADISETTAALRIFGDDLDPEEITLSLGSSPSRAARKGEQWAPMRSDERAARTGSWIIEATPRSPGDLDGQIHEIFQGLTSDMDVWLDLSKRFRVDLFCGVFLTDGNEGFSLGPEALEILSRRNIEIGFDVYARWT